ncbi:hypothetical protein [Rubripirellula reticaptiva]|uniref:Uncharacterized protein n=1 Tax=Rubripirellula reticaptiva TaxID=2528013 RepID=A0A5C6EL33_9BACT|nr:hypothetical protein [Rubripirellula reticaptiva]TWU49174.1 hypothetical protein Poly59_37880 [Rubripirellula reticaptiva]
MLRPASFLAEVGDTDPIKSDYCDGRNVPDNDGYVHANRDDVAPSNDLALSGTDLITPTPTSDDQAEAARGRVDSSPKVTRFG